MAVLNVFQVGDIVKLGKEGKTLVKGAKVVKVAKSQSKVCLELAPMTDEALEAAYKAKNKIPTPEEAFQPTHQLPYTDTLISVAGNSQKIPKSWFANYILISGNNRKGYTHIIRNHTLEYQPSRYSNAGQLQKLQGKDIFNNESQVRNLISEVLTSKMDVAVVTSSYDFYQIDYDFGYDIGYKVIIETGQAVVKRTSKIRIVLDQNRQVHTAYPLSRK